MLNIRLEVVEVGIKTKVRKSRVNSAKNKPLKLILLLALILLLLPMVSAGSFTDWIRDLFGMDVRISNTNYNSFNGYFIASDKMNYNCFKDNLDILNKCNPAKIGITNNNNYADEIYMFPEFAKDVIIQKIEIQDKINKSLWYIQVTYDNSDNKYNKKKTDFIKIKSGETINYRITFLPTEKYTGEFNVMIYSKKEKLFGIDPYYNLTNGFPLGDVGTPWGIHKYKGNYYVVSSNPGPSSLDRKSTRLNSSHIPLPRMPSSA